MSESNAPNRSFTKLTLKAEDDVAKGRYANLAQVSTTNDAFVLDFAFVQGGAAGWLLSRVILSPVHAKRFQRVLAETIARFEEQHGAIDEGVTLQ